MTAYGDIGPGNGFWPDGAKPLPEPVLAYKKCAYTALKTNFTGAQNMNSLDDS